MSHKFTLDLTPYLAYSLATNPSITKDVDSLYEKYKFRAYNAAKNSKYYSYPLLTDGSIKRDVSSKRALGLIEMNKEKLYPELDNAIIKLFEKGWNRLNSYVKTCDVLDVSYIMKNIIENKDDDDYFIGFNTTLLLFSTIYDKEIIPAEFKSYIVDYFQEYSFHLDFGDKRFSYNFVRKDKEIFNKAKNIKDRFIKNFKVLNNTCDLVDLVILDDELADLCRSINVIFDSENMMLSSMSDNAKILDKDIIELGALYFLHYKNQNRIESAKFILFGLHLKYAIKAYKDLKEFYFKNNKETLYIELEKHLNNIKVLEDNDLLLKRKIEALKHENNKLKKEYKDTIEKENILLNREIDKLKATISKLSDENKELKELTDSFFKVDNAGEEIIHKDNILIPDVKGVIAGGHSSWHDKIKGYLPDSFIYIEGGNERFDDNVLNNKDYIFIYTKFMSHGFYYRLIDKCKKMNIKIGYISSTSPSYLQREIIQIINNKKPTFIN